MIHVAKVVADDVVRAKPQVPAFVAINRPLRSPFAFGEGNLPLLKSFKGAILASKPPGSGGMSVKGSVMMKIAALVCSVFALLALAPKTANASTNINCTVTSVLWQKYVTPAPGQHSGVPTDILVIGCSDNTSYASYIGSPSEVELAPPAANAGCYASPDGVKALATLAIAARLSGRTLSIWWTARSCPGNAGQLSIDSVTLL